MIRRDVKSVTVEYEDGAVESFQMDGMFHVVRQNYSKGAKTPEQGWQQHEIRWVDPETMHPPLPEEDEGD